MPDIVQELTIEAAPEKVVNALTRQEELAPWWTNHVTAVPKVGSIAEFIFNNGAVVFRIEIADINPWKSVHCIVRRDPPRWAGNVGIWDHSLAGGAVRRLHGSHGV